MKKLQSRSELMKRSSRLLIIYCVSKYSRVSRAQIVEQTGLSRAHVCGVVDELIAEGELIETGTVSAGRGRPTVLLEINPDSMFAGGVWLAEDTIEVGVAGATGDILARESLPYSGDPMADLDIVVEALRSCAEQTGKTLGALNGIGVVVAGLVNPGLGLICVTTHEHGFEGVPVAKLLHEKVGIPVYADTDIRAAAVADQWQNARHERVLYVAFCDGVGAAFVSGRELFGSPHGAAPLLGHAALGHEGPLEPLTSNHTFVRNLWPHLDPKQLSPRKLQSMVKEGVDRALQGDYDAINEMSRIASYMGMGISIGVNMLDPQKVYVAGTLIDHAPDMMMDIIRREAMSRIDSLFQGVDIQPLMRLQEFEFKGAFGMVLFNRFRTLNQDVNAKFMPTYSLRGTARSIMPTPCSTSVEN